MFTCNNCGGELHFDIKSQKMLCDHCKSLFDPTLLSEAPTAKLDHAAGSANDLPTHGEQRSKYGFYQAVIYKCPQCGGEIISTEDAAVDYCTYCGSFVEFERHRGKGVRPEYIVPFEKTKEECIESYKAAAKKAVFAPDSMRTPAFLERFRGMYMPYWLYDVKLGGSAQIIATEGAKQEGNYSVTYAKSFPVEAKGTYENIAFDASSSFNDRISWQLTPFATGNMAPFSPAYMAGFYAVNADVDEETYKPAAETVAARVAMKSAIDAIHETEEGGHTKFDKLSDEEVRKKLDASVSEVKPALLPVWFLTWRQKNRVGYSVVNGVSGECVSMFPVSVVKFVAFALVLALPLYLVMDLLLTMTAPIALFGSTVMSLIMLFIYKQQLARIVRHEQHEDDIGFFTAKEREQNSERKRQKKIREAIAKKKNKKVLDVFLGILLFAVGELWQVALLGIIFLGEKLFSGYSDNGGFRRIGYLVVAGLLLYLLIKMFRTSKEIKSQLLLFAGVLPAITIFVAFGLEIYHPVDDLYYYAGVFANLFVILLLELILVGRYNVFVTEQVPNFFKEGSNPSLEKAPNMSVSDEQNGTVKNKFIYGVTIAAAAVMLVLAVVKTSDVDWREFVTETSHVIAGTAGDGESSGNTGSAGSLGSPLDGEASAVSLNGYELVINDMADLLDEDEELQLRQAMAPILEYGNVAFVSDYPYTDDTGLAAARAYDSLFKEEDGTEFYFDMRNRKIFIYSMGSVLKTIDKGYANTITDNVYKYASEGNYELCAQVAFEQMFTVLNGGKIAQPMKHISNLFLAVILGLLIGYSIMMRTILAQGKPGIEMIGGAGGLGAAIVVAQAGVAKRVLKQKRYNKSSGGGGSHGGYHGGGGFSGGHSGGGGGFHGGGGGHSF